MTASIKTRSSDEANASARHVTYDLYDKQGNYVTTYTDVIKAIAHRDQLNG